MWKFFGQFCKKFYFKLEPVAVLITELERPEVQSSERNSMRIHENKRFPCTECGKDFSEERAMKTHIKNIHEQILNFVCSEAGCGKAYANSSLLKNHVDRVHMGIKLYCDTCGQGFSTKYILKNHMEKMHINKKYGEESKYYKCDFEECSESFDKMGELRKHKKLDHIGDKTKYQCDECGKGYN